jgi:hypothetical protein
MSMPEKMDEGESREKTRSQKGGVGFGERQCINNSIRSEL